MRAPRPRPPVLPAPPPGPLLLLLLLLSGPGPGRASPRLLDQPPPVCSQQELNCTVTNSTCLDDSWIRPRNLTPSAPKDVQVKLNFTHTGGGDLVPVLHITWTLQTDGSVVHLEGAELSVLQLTTNQRLCVKFQFLSRLQHHGTRWHFNFSHFVVEPGQEYEVTVQHLPKSIPDGDPNQQSRNILVPDCGDPRMKLTTSCVNAGSLWDPNITVDALDAYRLRVSFTLWDEPAHYTVLLSSYPRADNQTCFRGTQDVSAPAQEAFRRADVTFTLPSTRWCCRHQVQVRPAFRSCLTDCFRRRVAVPCPETPPTPEPITEPMPLWAYGFITGLAVLLVASASLLVLCMTWRLSGSHHGNDTKDTDVPPAAPLTPPPLKPRKVWIVYSADHPLYVDVVLKFAQFLLTVCGTEVALDLLEERAIAEVGVMTWVGRRKQEMVESKSKILILCSRGTWAKWQAILGVEGPAVRLRCDRKQPTGDLFTAAMNMILPDFKKPACFGTYVVCYFSDVSSERDVPDLFNITPRYPLMSRFEEVYFRIQDLEMFEPGRMHRVGELAGGACLQSPSGRQLREALDRFREWQARCPDWFERENLCPAEDPDAPSLDEEVLEAPLLPPGGGILKQQPVVREPDAPLRVDLLPAGGGEGVARLQPRPPPKARPALRTLQTSVLPADAPPAAQAVQPVAHAGGSSAASRLALVEGGGEACPLLQGGSPRRNSVVFLPVDAGDPPLDSGPAPLPDLLPEDGREQLRGLMLSLFRQSLGCPAPEDWDAPAVALADPCTPDEDEQRQSVQSDQGYISRSSPQPPDGLTEPGDEEEGRPALRSATQQLPPEALASLRSLQRQLLFQELEKNSGWDSGIAERPVA